MVTQVTESHYCIYPESIFDMLMHDDCANCTSKDGCIDIYEISESDGFIEVKSESKQNTVVFPKEPEKTLERDPRIYPRKGDVLVLPGTPGNVFEVTEVEFYPAFGEIEDMHVVFTDNNVPGHWEWEIWQDAMSEAVIAIIADVPVQKFIVTYGYPFGCDQDFYTGDGGMKGWSKWIGDATQFTQLEVDCLTQVTDTLGVRVVAITPGLIKR